MGIRVIFVMTHDSIGVGEDGPTHQPIEQLAALRAIPNLLVMRPADGVETAECWQLALENARRPSLIAFSRQDVPTAAHHPHAENLSAKGAYELVGDAGCQGDLPRHRHGSQPGGGGARHAGRRRHCRARGVDALLEPVRGTAGRLSQAGPGPRHRQGRHRGRRAAKAGIAISVGAAGTAGAFVGMHSFGASGPYKDVYAKHFGITAEAAAEAAKKLLK